MPLIPTPFSTNGNVAFGLLCSFGSIEIECGIYDFIRNEILGRINQVGSMSAEQFVIICFKKGLKQILEDPTEYGKLMLNPVRKSHSMPAVDIKEENQKD